MKINCMIAFVLSFVQPNLSHAEYQWAPGASWSSADNRINENVPNSEQLTTNYPINPFTGMGESVEDSGRMHGPQSRRLCENKVMEIHPIKQHRSYESYFSGRTYLQTGSLVSTEVNYVGSFTGSTGWHFSYHVWHTCEGTSSDGVAAWGLNRFGTCSSRASATDGQLTSCNTPLARLRNPRTRRMQDIVYSNRVYDPSNSNEFSSALNLRNLNFTNSRFENIGLREAFISRSNFSNTRFLNARLWNSRVVDSDFSGARFRGGVVDIRSGVASRGGQIEGTHSVANFSNTAFEVNPEQQGIYNNVVRLNIAGGSLENTQISTQSPVSKLNLFSVNARNLSASGAVLQNSGFAFTDLRGANFSGAQLPMSKFKNTQVDGANFTSANLQAMIWNSTDAVFAGANFQGADLSWSVFGFVQTRSDRDSSPYLRHLPTYSAQLRMENLNFTDAKLNYSAIVSAVRSLNPAQLIVSNVNFQNADMRGMLIGHKYQSPSYDSGYKDLVGRTAYARGSIKFESNVNFNGVNLSSACISQLVDLSAADLSNANLAGTKFVSNTSDPAFEVNAKLPFSREVAIQRGMIPVLRCE